MRLFRGEKEAARVVVVWKNCMMYPKRTKSLESIPFNGHSIARCGTETSG